MGNEHRHLQSLVQAAAKIFVMLQTVDLIAVVVEALWQLLHRQGNF